MQKRAPLVELHDWREAIRSRTPESLKWLARLALGRPEELQIHSEVLLLARAVASKIDLWQNDYIHVASYNAVNGDTIKATPVDPESVRELPAGPEGETIRSEMPIATLRISGVLPRDAEQSSAHVRRHYSLTFGVVPLTDGRRIIQVDTFGFFGFISGSRASQEVQTALEQLFVDASPDLADNMRRMNVGYLDADGQFEPDARAVNPHAFNSDWIGAIHAISSSDAPNAYFSIENDIVEEQYFTPWK